MRFRAIIGLYSLLLLGGSLTAQVTLQFRPSDAEYSTAINRFVMIAEAPNQLHIYDPVTHNDVTVNLPKTPICLSLMPNGLYAAVGFDSLIVTVNLTTGAIDKSHAAPGVVNSLVAAADYIHFEVNQQVRSMLTSTGAISQPPNISVSLAQAKLHPSGASIYTGGSGWGVRIKVETGPALTMESGYAPNSLQWCEEFWFSQDLQKSFSGCTSVWGPLGNLSESVSYTGRLAGQYRIRALAESGSLQRIVTVPHSGGYPVESGNARENEVLIYDSASLDLKGRLRLADFTVGSSSFQAFGKYMAFDSTGTKLYIISQAHNNSGLLKDFAIESFSFDNPAPCVPVLDPASSVSVPWNGHTDKIAVTAPAGCMYSASSSVSWIQPVRAERGSGTGPIVYHVRANMGAARSGELTIGGQVISFSQAAAPSPLPSRWRLSYSVVDAEYSRALDRTVLVTSGLNELHLFDSSAGIDQVVALTKEPRCVGLSPDGLSAAVRHDGSVSIVNLQTLEVVKHLPGKIQASDAVFAGYGYVHLASRSGYSIPLMSVEIATGTVTKATGFGYGHGVMRLHPAGEYLYAGGTSYYKWLVTGGVAASLQYSNGSLCSDFWFSQDGGRIFSACANVHRTSAVLGQDLSSNGNLNQSQDYGTYSWIDHSQARGALAGFYSTWHGYSPTKIRLYGEEFLGLSSERPLPTIRIANSEVSMMGTFLFWSADSSRLTAFYRDPQNAGFLNDTTIDNIAPNIGTNGCTASLSASSANAAPLGESGSISLTSGTDCVWTGTSSAPWLRITAGTFGFGNGSIFYTADRNPYGLPRSATLTLGGQTFTVSQAAGTPTGVPSIVTVAPSNIQLPSAPVTFTVRDPDGFANLSRIYFHLGANATLGPNGCHGLYDRAANQIALYNDALTAIAGAVTPGAVNTVENGQCRISGTGSALVSATGTDLAVTINLTMKGSYGNGTRNLYTWVVDAQGNGTGWVQTGTWTTTTVNSAPAILSSTPATATGPQNAFAISIRDANGIDDLYRVYFLVNTAATIPTGTCHGFYDRQTNGLYLYNDALSAITGPIVPGASGTIQNTQCKIDAANASVTANGSLDLNLSLGIQAQGAYAAGTRNVYFWVVDKSALGTGWIKTSTWTAAAGNQPPAVVSGTPNTGTSTTQRITFLARDPDGAANISRLYFLVNPTLSIPANTCHGFYDRTTNRIWLYSDGLSSLGTPIAPAPGNTLQNSQCDVSAPVTPAVTESGTDLALTLEFTVKGILATGVQKVAIWAVDAQGNGTGWVETGTITPSSGSPAAPLLLSVTPTASSNPVTTFAITASDANGAANLSRFYFVVNTTATVTANGCHGFYDRASNAAYLFNDALSQVLGPVAPGTNTTIENGQCKLSGTTLSVTTNGNEMTVNFPLELKGAFLSGSRNFLVWITDIGNLGTGWQQGTVWSSAGNVAPSIVSAPASGPGTNRTFLVTARDTNGAADIGRIYFQIGGSSGLGANVCHGLYDGATGKIFLYNDALSQLVGSGITPGQSGTVQNSQCLISGPSSSVVSSGTDVTLSLNVTRLGSYNGATLGIYWWAVDQAALGTGWVAGGTWTP